MASLNVSLWRGPETDPDDAATAAEALTDTFGEQLPVEIRVDRRGQLGLSGAPFDSYREYLDAVEREVDPEPGTVTLALYHWDLVDGLDELFDAVREELHEREWLACSDCGDADVDAIDHPPWCGYELGSIGPEETPIAVVNTLWESIPLSCTFENFVVHELLHAVLDDARSPHPGNEHAFGTVHPDGISPMLTGYAESFSTNPTPPAACGLETVPTENSHTTELSACTIEEIERQLVDDPAG